LKKNIQENVLVSAILPFDNQEARIERLAPGENEPGAIRLSGWKLGQAFPEPLVITEKQFIELVHQAIHVGVLSQDFVQKLRDWIEI
jgi:hypothetical protein